MSSTNKTTNYNLSQFLGSDKPAWLVDYNSDMNAIDTQMKANADAASAAQGTANTADSKADTNADAIGTLNAQINGASGMAADVASLQGSVNTITSLIGNGEPTTTDKTIIGAINELDSDINEISTELHDTYVISNIVATMVSVTADGVKTYSELLDTLHAAFATYVASLENGVRIEPKELSFGGNHAPITSPTTLVNDTTVSTYKFTQIANVSADVHIDAITLRSSASSYNSIVTTMSDGTTTATVASAEVPTNGTEITIKGAVYHRI